MNEPDVTKAPAKAELDPSLVEQVGGGGDTCSLRDLEAVTAALKQSYENLVDFASHVIERVAGGPGNP